MPVKLQIAFDTGWKKDENNRLGDVMVVRFNNEEGGEVMFEYAPRHSDAPWFAAMFKELLAYDLAMKEMERHRSNLLALNDVKESGGCGGC